MARAKPKTKAGKKAKMEKTMSEYKEGDLKIGKSDKPVKSRAQAIAIGLNQSGQSRKTKARDKRLESAKL